MSDSGHIDDFESHPAFTVCAPAQQRVPFIFNTPHSGRVYPSSFFAASGLTPQALRRSEDVMVDELFASVVEIGAPLLAAQFPRAWLDVNREPLELDPQLFRQRLPAHANSRSMRVVGGLGTIPRLVSENMLIYETPPTLEEGLTRIDRIYRPYHAALRNMFEDTLEQFGHAVLVDCHSMPSRGGRKEKAPRPDVVIGDRYGTSCAGEITSELAQRFGDLGYSVARNKPYAGGFITENYGRPLRGYHAVQIELNRGVYMNETTLEMLPRFDQLRDDIRKVVGHLVSVPDGSFGPFESIFPLAAE